MVTGTRVQILDDAICVLQSTNTLRKDMRPIIILSARSKYKGRLVFLTLVWQPVLVKENADFKTSLVSRPAL